MWLNVGVSLICSRISSSRTSALSVVLDISVVTIVPVAIVVDIVGKRVKGTVDIPRLMMVFIILLLMISGVNVGASIPN